MKSFTSSVLDCVIVVIISSSIITAIDIPKLVLNGNSKSTQNLTIGSPVEITCTANPTYDVSYLRIQRDGSTIKYTSNPVGNTIKYHINVTCKDNAVFRCYGRMDDATKYSTNIRVNTPCPPTPDVAGPVVYVKQPGASDTYGSPFYVRGNPKPIFTSMKVTLQGLVNLPSAVQLRLHTNGFRFYFYNYTEQEYGTYLIKAENTHGVCTANLTYRGLIANPTNLVAWSTSPNSIHVKFRAGETFNVAVSYYIRYWIDGETSSNNHYVKAVVGNTITATLNSLDPEITYNIFVQARHPQYGYSLYSQETTETTIKQGDPPQTEPDNSPSTAPGNVPGNFPGNVPGNVSPTTSDKGSTTPKLSMISASSAYYTGGSEGLGFGAGIGIGLSVGILIAITAVIVAIVYVKRRNATPKTTVTDTSPQQYPPGEEHVYENVIGEQNNYEILQHKGAAHHNKAFNRK